MPRRELLTPAEPESLLTVPMIEADQIRYYTLSRSDLAFIRQHRWDYNRLDVAIQLCYLRSPDGSLTELHSRTSNCRLWQSASSQSINAWTRRDCSLRRG
jgi:hypothetical protein